MFGLQIAKKKKIKDHKVCGTFAIPLRANNKKSSQQERKLIIVFTRACYLIPF